MALAYRPEIDGLRAIAVAAVVLFHAGATTTAGFVGVDVFFVISGYLITSLLLREREASGRIDLPAFYARRARRILPAALVVIATTLAVSGLLFDFRQQVTVAESAVAATVFLANMFFQANTGGYFQESAELMPLLHYWSLSVEEQFYLFWPLLLLLVPRRHMLKAMSLVALASLGFAEWLDAEAAFFNAFSRVWELAVGGIVATLPARLLPRWVLWLGLLVILDACLVPMTRFPGVGAIPAVAGTALVLSAIHGGGTNALLASAPAVGLGRISYSLYLWHWPLLVFFRVTGGGSTLAMIGVCVVALVLAIGSYRYIEQPFRKRGMGGLADRRTLVAGAACMAAVVVAAISIRTTSLASPQAVAAYDQPSGTCHNRLPDASCASAAGPVAVAIWGDSMAYSWQPLAAELARRQGAAALSYSMDGCKSALGYTNPARPHCRTWASAVAERIGDLDTVILAGRWDFEFYERDAREAETALRATMDRLKDVRRVVILGPLPVLRAKAYQCLEGNDLARCAVRRTDFLRSSAAIRNSLESIARSYPNAEYIEVSDWFCRESTCTATRDGMVLYYDSFHVSRTAATSFGAEF